jgi:hypothetical protein
MTFIDFQIDAQRFLAAQRTYLRRLAVCPPVIPPINGVQIVLDRVDIGTSSLRHDQPDEFDVFYVDHGEVRGSTPLAKGFRTKLAQQLTLQFTTADLIRDNANGDPPLTPWPVTVVYDLSAFARDEECFLRAAPDSVEFGPPPALPVALPPPVMATLEALVSSQLRVLAPSGTVPMGLAELDLPTGYLNAGVTVDAGGQTLAIRVEIRASQNPLWAAWTDFYRGIITDRRLGRDWAVFVPGAYIEHRITTELWQQIPRNDDLEAYPGAVYSVEDSRAKVTVDVLLIYHAVEVDELDLDVTVQADPKVDVTMWVESVNNVSALIDFSGLVNPVGFLSNLAVAVVDALGIPARSILYRVVGSAIVDELKGQPVAVSQPSATTVRIDKRVAPPSIRGVIGASVTDLLAHPDGIALAGSLNVVEPTNAVATVLDVRQLTKQVPPISCGAASIALVALFGSDPSGFAVLGGRAAIGNLGMAPLHLCVPPELQRLDGPVQPRNIRTDETSPPIELFFNVGLPSHQFYDAPFSTDILVRTNGGTRMIRLDPPPVLTQADLDLIQTQLLVEVANCEQLVNPWFKYFRGYNPRWSPRPPGDLDSLHRWEVVVSGLPAGDSVQLQGPDGAVLASAVSADPRASVSVTTVVPAVTEGREVGIVRVAGAEGGGVVEEGPDAPALGIEVRQTNLVIEGELPLAQPVHSLGLTSLEDRPVVVALMADEAAALDLGAGAPAVPVAQWSGEFTGMVGVPGGALLFGPGGVARLDRAGALHATQIDSPVLDAAASSAGLFLVTPDRVLHTTTDLQPVAELARSDVTSVAVVGHDVLLGHAGGVDLVNEQLGAVGRGRVRAARVTRSGAIRSLARASGVRRGAAVLATLDDGRAALIAREGDQFAEVGEFSSAPALSGAVRVGDTFVQVSDEAPERLRVLRVGTTVTLGPAE